MANVKISGLPTASTPLTGAELVPVVQSGVTSQTTVNAFALDKLAANTGSSLVGYLPSGTNAVATTVQAKLRETVSVKDFGAVGDGSTPNATAINSAIQYAYDNGGGTVYFPEGIYGVETSIVLKAGVFLIGQSASNYMSGLQYYSDTNDATFGTRIKALSSFPASTDLITMDVAANGSPKRRQGRGAYNLILDGNKYARNVIRCVGDITDFRTNFELCSIQGATSDGVYLANAVALTFSDTVISANNGYGIYCGYGLSDSTFNNLYIHTNQNGGMFFGDGSLYNQINNGKIEDNYGAGIYVSQSGATFTIALIRGVIFQTNNGPAVACNGTNAQAFLVGVRSNNAASANPSGATDAHCYVSTGLIDVKSSYFDNTANYVFSSVNSGTITVGGDTVYEGGATSVYYTSASGAVRFPNGIDSNSGKLPLRNRGGRKQLVSIATSSSQTITFSNAFDNGVNSNYYDSANYLLVVMCAPTQPTIDYRVIGTYIVSIAGVGGTVSSVQAVLTSPAPDATILASVAAAVTGRNIEITITSGATHATGGRSSIFNVQLVDIGQNMFGLDG